MFVLKETLASKKADKPIYFHKWVGIGPMTTPDLEKAAKFDTKEEAMRSPAYPFPLAFFEPEEVEEPDGL